MKKYMDIIILNMIIYKKYLYKNFYLFYRKIDIIIDNIE